MGSKSSGAVAFATADADAVIVAGSLHIQHNS